MAVGIQSKYHCSSSFNSDASSNAFHNKEFSPNEHFRMKNMNRKNENDKQKKNYDNSNTYRNRYN